jgi:uncharacterized glyoxalase superfamily protein PhnB
VRHIRPSKGRPEGKIDVAVTNPNPQDWPSVIPRIVVRDPAALVEFLQHVFGASGQFRTDGPSELTIGDSLVMVSAAGSREPFPAFLYVYAADADVTYQRALNRGAVSLEAVWDTPYGDRRGMVKDPWGNVWQMATRMP